MPTFKDFNKKEFRLSENQKENSDCQNVREDQIARVEKVEWKNIRPAHERLRIWQKAHQMHIYICQICKNLPKTEQYKLIDQIERSSKSVKDNIAEANESFYFDEKRKGLYIARREAGETQSHLRDFQDKKYLNTIEVQRIIDEYEQIKRGINGLVRAIADKKTTSSKKGSKSSHL